MNIRDNMINKVIVLGSDHYNAIGVAQSLGIEGVHVIAVIAGGSKLISKSRLIKRLYNVDTLKDGIELIANKLVFDMPAVIIPCGDSAALLLEKNKNRLSPNFLFQHTTKELTIERAMNKNVQAQLAKHAGLDIPFSFEARSFEDVPTQIQYPVIIKPLLSCEGDKRDIFVARSASESQDCLKSYFKNGVSVIVQQFIDKKNRELNILGCSLTSGECIVPLSIEKVRTHPVGRGSVSVGKVEPLDDGLKEIIGKINLLIQNIGYIGLFSVELMEVKDKNKCYFIELNLRNDALNSFIVKAGVNLPYLHYQDLNGFQFKDYVPANEPIQMICEPIHLASLFRRSISICEWFNDIIKSKSFMLYFKQDKKIFYFQFWIKIFGHF